MVLPLVGHELLPRILLTLGKIGTILGSTPGKMHLLQVEKAKTRNGLRHPDGTLATGGMIGMIPLAGFDARETCQTLRGM